MHEDALIAATCRVDESIHVVEVGKEVDRAVLFDHDGHADPRVGRGQRTQARTIAPFVPWYFQRLHVANIDHVFDVESAK